MAKPAPRPKRRASAPTPSLLDERIIEALVAHTRAGSRSARNQLFMALYPTLRRFAGRFMRGQPVRHTLQPSALINETYLKLIRRTSGWELQTHFLAAAARAMRCVLVDFARARKSRVGRTAAMDLDQVAVKFEDKAIDLIALGDALEELERERPLAAVIVDLHFFAGEEFRSVARVLGIPLRTVEREWASARAWLFGTIAR